MKVVIQRVASARVAVDAQIVGSIHTGLLLLVGMSETDNATTIEKMVKKILNLRIFEDDDGKMNRSILDVGGEILSVSQFTLFADCSRWNRPSFIGAGNPAIARQLWEDFNAKILENMGTIETGIFGADMKVTLENDGPVTIILESEMF